MMRPPNANDVPAAGQLPSDQEVLITVTWKRSVEHIVLDFSVLKAGDVLETVESWKDGSGEVTYEVICSDVGVSDRGERIVTLTYDAGLGNNSLLAQDDPSLQWGQTTITVDAELVCERATFTAIDGAVATGTCKSRSTSLYQDLSLGVANVLLRPGQAAVRRFLLRTFQKCAISNEPSEAVLEVAHIIRHADGGVAQASNAILLRADLHKLYDAGLIAIDPDGVIDLCGIPEESEYRKEVARWNPRLRDDVLAQVRAALQLRSEAS